MSLVCSAVKVCREPPMPVPKIDAHTLRGVSAQEAARSALTAWQAAPHGVLGVEVARGLGLLHIGGGGSKSRQPERASLAL